MLKWIGLMLSAVFLMGAALEAKETRNVTIPALKKIEILESNNEFPSAQAERFYASPIEAGRLAELRTYVSKRVALDPSKDPGAIIAALGWVSNQWKHDGMNEAPRDASALQILRNVHQRAEKYRCVEFGFVLAELLRALGYSSRTIGMQSSDVAYGGVGRGPVATEVWSNHFAKWIFIDPQFSVYPQYKGKFLSYYELYRLKKGLFRRNCGFSEVTIGQLRGASRHHAEDTALPLPARRPLV